MRVMALASGSSGNSYLVQAGDTAVLVDAGLPLNSLEPALAGAGVDVAQLRCLLLTHEHRDHLASAAPLSRRYRLPLLGTAGTLACLPGRCGQQQCLSPGSSLAIGPLTISAFSVPHDSAEPVGFLFECDGVRAVLATDLGHVPAELLPVFRSCQLLIIEANHDVKRLWRGPYPQALKQRVAAPTGHLSNDQAAECLLSCSGSEQKWVWLAHLSAVNNSPRGALRAVTDRLRQEQVSTVKVSVALRDRPSLSWNSTEAFYQPRLL